MQHLIIRIICVVFLASIFLTERGAAENIASENPQTEAEEDIDCEDPPTAFDRKMCNGIEIQRLDKELNSVLEKALAATPKDGTTNDKRKERQQLIESQDAWNKFREENCAFIGGLEGGNNQWVTIFSQMCEKEMLEDRIKFLKKIAHEE